LEDVRGPEGFASGRMLQKYFDELDHLQAAGANDILLLSEEVPYAQQVLALLWASGRGIPVITERINNKTLSARYAGSADNFPMEFGLFHFGSYAESATGNKYSQLFDTVQYADKNGFVAVWTPERHFNQFGGLFPNPSVLSAALAVSTSRVQIRCGSIVAPLHHPVRIAEDWSLIDNLSGGRAAVSFASGWQCDDFIFFPDNYPERHQCMMDQLSMVRKLWKGEKLLFRNGLNKEVEIGIFPKPVQQEIPIWITVSNRTETFIDAGKVGANILTHLLWQDTDELIEKIAAYRKSLEENGYDPRSRKVSLMVHTYLGNDNETVKNKVREPLKNYIRSSTQLIQAMAKSNAVSSNAREVGGRYGSLNNEVPAHLMDELVEIAFNRFFEEAALLGTVDKAAKLLRKLKTYDVDEIASLIDFGLSRDDIMEGLTYLNELKNKYDRKGHNLSPVTITYCSGTELDLLPGIQRVILAEEEGLEKNDNPALQGASVVRQYREDGEIIFTIKHSGAAIVAAEDFFTTAVSNDFE
jgi:natural product biosynthesis luciferase-like monooxygenase protein